MLSTDLKHQAHRIVEDLPENSTWEDLMYKIYVRQAIEAGMEDSQAGRTVDVKQVRAKSRLPEVPYSP